jgi:aspartyl-tRNA(Asn)/glutamyl-tRNA(Gln) amidotransferase subunit A
VSDFHCWAADRIAGAVGSGEVTAETVARHFLERIDRLDDKVGAFLQVDTQGAIEQARAVDRDIAAGKPPGPMSGVPVGIKDNICTRGLPTTCASRILEGFVSPYDAEVVKRLRDAGAVILGKLNLDEFAMGSSCENSGLGRTVNPWDPDRVPGGSSGGSAAAVAAGLATITLGSDTGGSIRQPAALCGVVGLKPTYGRVSRFGLIAFASSLDQIGPFAMDISGVALTLSVLAGEDPQDSTCIAASVPDYLGTLEGSLEGKKIGIPREYFEFEMHAGISQCVERAAQVYRDLGVEVVEVPMPHTKHAIATYYLVANAEASSNLARYDGVHYGHRNQEAKELVEMSCRSRSEGFGDEVQRRIMLGTFALSSGYYDAYYLRALKVRQLIRQDFDAAFEQVDALLCPTSPIPAFRMGEKVEDPMQMYLCDIMTAPASLAGVPAISVPCGFVEEEGRSLPVGLHLVSRPFEEETLLGIARAFEVRYEGSGRMPAEVL